jgi:beta-alanine--pyruvate transaminase
LRQICDKHGILLIFDEVITGFGRVGKAFAATRFAITPDIITCAKGLTNGTVPMGAVICKNAIYEAFMQGPEWAVELFHGYTYTAHPLACAASLASLDLFEAEKLFERTLELQPYFEQAVHSLKGAPHVVDIRNIGLVAGIEMAPRPGEPGKRGFDAFLKIYEKGVLPRITGDIIALSPPLIVEKPQIDRIVETIDQVLKTLN